MTWSSAEVRREHILKVLAMSDPPLTVADIAERMPLELVNYMGGSSDMVRPTVGKIQPQLKILQQVGFVAQHAPRRVAIYWSVTPLGIEQIGRGPINRWDAAKVLAQYVEELWRLPAYHR